MAGFMDHDHSHMDHSHHMHMAGAGASPTMDTEAMRCSMNMLFTWNTQNLCLVFRWWRVDGPISLILSLLGVVLLSAGYEYLRALTRRYEARVDARIAALPPANDETSSLLPTGRSGEAKTSRITKGIFYGLQVFYSFFIMLLFMTYNGWVMIAVAVGAFVGYVVWGDTSATKSVACH